MSDNHQSIESLNEYFGIDQILRFEIGKGGLTCAQITHPTVNATVYLHGGHVTHFMPTGHKPILYLSPDAVFDERAAIRGGIPIVFPWFGPKANDPNAPVHGLARTAEWRLHRAQNHEQKITLELINHIAPYEVRLFIAFSEHLTMTLKVDNLSDNPQTFEEAMHTYFHVQDIEQVILTGLEGCSYVDKVQGGIEQPPRGKPITITGETDRVYLKATRTCMIEDPALNRRIYIDKHHSNSTIVWNPWIEKSQSLKDMPDDDWKKMLCVEFANVRQNAVTLQPGRFHEMTMVIRAEHLS
ncbi:D-hexose-6-phosphate mutarotase [Poriferisphaera sp. WC338]|uniref:D-hexose-6-phosphate mutarotase n=1 Tax=Poriferisphaera sp. WC338 TaxID=3425129 RepID=UPI003D818BE5